MVYLDRDLCRILEDIEGCYQSRNFSPLPGLIVELKIMSSRVEMVQTLKEDYEKAVKHHTKINKLRMERNALSDEVEALKVELEILKTGKAPTGKDFGD